MILSSIQVRGRLVWIIKTTILNMVIFSILILDARKGFVWKVRVEPGLEWLKLDIFSAKGVTPDHDTIIEYYWLGHQ